MSNEHLDIKSLQTTSIHKTKGSRPHMYLIQSIYVVLKDWKSIIQVPLTPKDHNESNGNKSHIVASTSGSFSTGTLGILLLPLKREDTLSMAELSWLIFSFKVWRVLCFQGKEMDWNIKIKYLHIKLAGSSQVHRVGNK